MRLSLQMLLLALVVFVPLPVRAAEADIVTKLPSKCEECQTAGSGRYLVLKLRNARGLTVYDSTTQKVTTLDLPDEDIVYAAGGDTVLVYLRDANELQTWSLATGKLVKAKGFVNKPNIQTLVMGHSRGDIAIMRGGRNQNGGYDPDQLVDTTEIRATPIKDNTPGGNGRQWDLSHLRANGDLSRLIDRSATAENTGFAILNRTDAGYTYTPGSGSGSNVVPGDDGRIYTPFGMSFEPDPNYNPNIGGSPFKMSAPIKGKTLVPAIGGQFVLAVTREGGLTLYEPKQKDALAPLGDFPEWNPPKLDENLLQQFAGGFTGPDGQVVPFEDAGPGAIGEGATALTLDRRVCFAPGLDHILFVPHGNDRIVQRKFDLKATLDTVGEDYLMMVSVPALRAKGGAAWEYQLKTVAKHGPVKYELSKAPEGMTVSAEGKIAWTAPKGIVGRAAVEVRGTDAKGKVVRQVFTLNLE